MAEGEEEADSDGALALVHELAGDVVDGGDVVGVHGVTEAEAVGEEGGAEEHGEAMEGNDGPGPRTEIEDGEDGIDREDLGSGVAGLVVEEGTQRRGHLVALQARD